jgi:hypothetical protein
MSALLCFAVKGKNIGESKRTSRCLILRFPKISVSYLAFAFLYLTLDLGLGVLEGKACTEVLRMYLSQCRK